MEPGEGAGLSESMCEGGIRQGLPSAADKRGSGCDLEIHAANPSTGEGSSEKIVLQNVAERDFGRGKLG